MKLKRYNRFF